MSKNNSILSFIKAGLSKIEFLDNCAKANIQYQDDEDSSIFSNESTIEQVFDVIDINKDGKLDGSEINKFAALDETDGKNKLSEADMRVLYKKIAAEASKEIETSSPEEMYSKNVSSGKMSSQDYLGVLSGHIELLEDLIKLREQSGKNIIDELQSQLDQLIKTKRGDIKKQYQNKLNARNKFQQEIKSIDIKIKEQEEQNNRNSNMVILINAEISMLDSERDAEKIKYKQNEISEVNAKLSDGNAKTKNLQNQRSAISSQLGNVNGQINKLVAKATENDKKLQQQVAMLNKKIEQEKQSMETDIKIYKTQLDSLYAAQDYTVEQVIQQNATSWVYENYEDEDTSNFSYDSTALKQKWSKKAPWLTDGFYNKATEVSKRVGCDPNVLLAIMDSESGLKPSVQNKRGGASGLIQFMPSTARALGTTTDEIRKMSAEQQLVYVEKCLLANKKMAGFAANDKLDAGTMYALVFLPAYAKREVLALKGHKYYNSNAGLDLNGDGAITKQDLGARVRKRIPKG